MWEYVEMVEDCIFDTVIQNGTVVDGSGGSRFKADVGIKNNRSTVNNIVTYLNKNSTLKWILIFCAFYFLLFVIIALLNFFQE